MRQFILAGFKVCVLCLMAFQSMANDNDQMNTPSPVVSADSAYQLIQDHHNLVVLDVREMSTFNNGHISGSYPIWRPDYSADAGEYNFEGMRASREKMEVLLGDYGISSDTLILLLGEDANYDALRLWWQLDMYGHANIRIIDGGIDAWKQAKLPLVKVSSTQPIPTSYAFEREADLSTNVSLQEVIEATSSPDTVIIDNRGKLERAGLVQLEDAFAKGRIPNSIHLEWDEFINPDQTFKSAKQIEIILKYHGITRHTNLIIYCQSGVRSAHMTFVINKILGWDNAKNYDGSWVEWSYEATKGNVEIENPSLMSSLFDGL